ncbi:PQQ-binding-like beta-propeller repeat protein [Streptomyces sp. YC504]|uniref:PQQ-binding-like beta-propeller repeat protein n=1 Tax=Streptomyces mesophilus TaxID=1775132 RepID=A0A6G4XSF0_9ACTN|nr:aryl-sulfate sulfotransferase [Streptomyces mesophilus]NGO79710.1 PQQ-binding-like beta-propeller repeat protein [Streptomyces mesophilus]
MPRVDQNSRRRRGTGLIALDGEAASPGYTLFAPLTGSGEVHLVDLHGRVVHEWRLPYRPGRHARILPGGNLAYNGVLPDEPALFPMWHKYRGGVMLQAAPDGTVLREHRDPLQHHDANHLDDGRILYAALEPLTGAAADAVRGGVPGSEADGGIVWADTIKEVDADGTELWSWRAAEHLDREAYALHPDYAREHWPLINSVAELADGNIVASLRSTSAVIVISRATGEVLWRTDPGTVSQQHHPTELPGGNLLVFDNGVFRPGSDVPYSRVIEIERGSGKVVWEYHDPAKESFFAPFMGAAQRLPNGNTLITDSPAGRLFEVTADGYLCWEYVVPQFAAYEDSAVRSLFPSEPNAVFRAYRYAAEELPWLEAGA